MKICKFIEGSFIPSFDGASQRFASISKNLSNKGIDLTIIHCYRGWSNLNIIKNEKFKTIAVSPKYYYHDYSVVDKIISQIKPDLVEMNDMELIMSTGAYINKKYKIPIIYEAHFVSSVLAKDVTKNTNVVKLERLHEKKVTKIVSGIICFTEIDKKDLIMSTKMDSKRIRVIPLESDLNTIKFKKVTQKDNIVLFLGNMYFQPNHEAVENIVNNIAPLVFKKNKKIIFRFVGDVPDILRKKYQNKKIIFKGRVEDINQVFKDVRVCIVPVMTGGGMRVKILTYMASGVPIISTKVAAAGIHYKRFMNIANNSAQFAKKIIEIINDLSKSINQGKLAYLEALKNHSGKAIAQKNISFYKTIIKKPIISSFRPVKVTADPFWLTETIQKGRFKKIEIDQEKIYILGRGNMKIRKSDNFDYKDILFN